MKAEFLELAPDGQKLCALLFYHKGKIWGEPVGNGNDTLVNSILRDDVVVKGNVINREDDPEAWFKGLPHQYNGTYLRAKLVEDSPMEHEVFAPTVRELHVDFLLEEEFCANPDFLRNFIEAADRHDLPVEVESIEHSVSDQYGEADLIVVYKRLTSEERIAILIEDKIRAIFQPDQAERYRRRGDSGKGHEWQEYWTCLVAPEIYIKPGHGFHVALKLEQIKEWLAIDQPKRHQFKAGVIERAINKAKTTGVQKVDEIMTNFREKYFAFFNEYFKDVHQEVRMREPAPTWKGDSWFDIRSRLLPKGAYVNHKSPSGFVDLTFPSAEAAQLKPIESYLEPGMTIEQTGNSAAVRLQVAKIERFDEFNREQAAVAEGLAAVKRLLAFYARERGRLDPILKSARIGITSQESAHETN